MLEQELSVARDVSARMRQEMENLKDALKATEQDKALIKRRMSGDLTVDTSQLALRHKEVNFPFPPFSLTRGEFQLHFFPPKIYIRNADRPHCANVLQLQYRSHNITLLRQARSLWVDSIGPYL